MVREHIDALRDGMRRRGALEAFSPAIDRAITLDKARRDTIQAVEERKAARNAVSQQVGQRKRAGESADDLQQRSRELGDEIARLDRELAETETELSAILLELPNITLDQVPAGGEESNEVVRTWGTPRERARVQPHWEIGARLGLIDLERGAKISGSGFIVFRRSGARLVRSLINFALDIFAGELGYEETWVPVVVNRASMIGTRYCPSRSCRRRSPRILPASVERLALPAKTRGDCSGFTNSTRSSWCASSPPKPQAINWSC